LINTSSGVLATIDLSEATAARDVAQRILDVWRTSLIVHVRGVGVRDDLFAFYDHVIEQVGTPVEIAEDATVGDREHQRTGQRWMEVRFDPAVPDAYRHSANAQPLHTDGSYIPAFPSATFMFCVSAARQGGETVFLTGESLVDILDRRQPELLTRLVTQPIRHLRSGDQRTEPVVRWHEDGHPLLNWNYYCVDPNASEGVRELSEDLFAFLANDPEIGESVVSVNLQPGEAVVWKDDRLIHGRNAFLAENVSERFIWKCAVDVGVWQDARV
jgi:alpha-ketoglutarate-dependent taurine dioxygenase